MSEIVIGYDGSDSSKSALNQAFEFAKALKDSLVVVFAAAPGGYGGGEVPEQRKAVEEYGQKVIQEAVEAAKAAKVKCQVEMINEHPHDALMTAADKHDARMIVVGSHGDHPVVGAIIGATPYKLVQLSKPSGAGRQGVSGAAGTGGGNCVVLDSVTKRFGGLVAVDAIDLEIEEGEFFTMLGPSGCGKTTTLRMIAGFEDVTDGRLTIDDADMLGIPPHKRPTNTVFQSYALFPHLSVKENVAFGLKRKGAEKDEIEQRVREELERVGLAAEANRRPAQLSGGMQQRVALARALVNLPRVLLLDEPLGALDLKLRKGLQVELKKIQREVGITFVYVTHDQEEALTMSDRIAVMNRGRIEQIGDPEEVYDRPSTTFVAGFIGVSNLMPGVIRKTGDGGEVELDGGVKVGTDVNGFSVGERCHAVVRPEKLAIGAGDPRRPDRGGPGRELALPRHGHPADREAGGERAHDRPRPEHRRVGAPAPPGRRREREAFLEP